MTTIEVLVPSAATRITEHPLAPRPDALAGASIAWLDNSKANAAALLGAIDQAWRRGGDDYAVATLSKDATRAAPDAVMAHLRTRDAVVLAIAD